MSNGPKHFVVIFPIRYNQEARTWEVCLPKKKKAIGAGRRNGYGGKIKPGEQLQEAARREFKEENGIEAAPSRFIFIGTGWFHNHDAIPWRAIVEIFFIVLTDEVLAESEEMGPPEWFPFLPEQQLPLHELMPADVHWLPVMLNRILWEKPEPIHVEAHLSAGQQSLIGHIVLLDQSNMNQRQNLVPIVA